MFMGLDIGTSGVKAAIVAENGSVLDHATRAIPIERRAPLWSEQDPGNWWRATEAAVAALDPKLRSGVLGVGLAGQMHGATLLGVNDRPLRPAILWNDGRSFAECTELERAVPDARAITGNIAMAGFTAPKLLWVRRHEPETFAAVHHVLLPKDFVRLCMTGDKASDLSDSAGTLWLDVGGRRWSEAMLDACGLGVGQMPALFEGTEITGSLRGDVAARWGMANVPVAGGGGDNAAGAAGVGVVGEGDALLSLGTSGVIFAATHDFRPVPGNAVHAFCHCMPGMWHQMSVHLAAAACLDWAATVLGTDGPAGLLTLAAASDAIGSEMFLPYLSGERTPHNDPHVRGAWLGLASDTSRERLAATVLEGVAFALADGIDALRAGGTDPAELSVIGGGGRSAAWGRTIAAAIGVPLIYLEGGEVGPALGAARLAQIAVTGARISDVCRRPAVRDIIEPDALLAEALAPNRARFRSAYGAIRGLH